MKREHPSYARDMEPRPHHLFIVEDDPALRDMLADYLEKQGLAVTTMAKAPV